MAVPSSMDPFLSFVCEVFAQSPHTPHTHTLYSHTLWSLVCGFSSTQLDLPDFFFFFFEYCPQATGVFALTKCLRIDISQGKP